MGESKETPKQVEKKVLGCTVSTWVKFINMIVGGLMIAFGIFSFFRIPELSGDAVLIYSFKVYEM